MAVLRDHGPLSRQQIGEITGLSPATVNRLTKSMLAEKLLVVDGHEASTGGRPSLILRYTGGSRVVAALQLRRDEMRAALVDFDGNIIEHRSVSVPSHARGAKADSEKRVEAVGDLLDDLMDVAQRASTPCQAVGISVPGVIEKSTNKVGVIPELGWPRAPIAELLRDRSDLPIVVENDANALAFAEYLSGAGVGMTSLVAVLLDNGMGAGIISNGAIHRGQHGEAGEIGYLLMDRAALARSYEDLGDLEDRVGSVAITREARRRGIKVSGGRVLTARDIISLAATGDARAEELLEEILDLVAMAVAAITVVIDPEAIIVGSDLSTPDEEIMARIRNRLVGRVIRVPQLIPSQLGADAVLLGVAELAIRSVAPTGFAARA
ncbi:sugar kinase [Flexivirga endophytica]|uniref:Sugar kinase n=1 Tax=Flexivirga endophytica TaxID=1849103 RepID=A0A916SXN0_9MICO|nr:sugar kinase [Flexivirga endophytica]GHB36954.1 sugar kinase [Flexivirga endophytica]